jgi:membrane-associated phospholipid phosphatase
MIKTVGQKFIISLFLLITCEFSLFGQNKYNLSQFGHETVSFIKSPAKWNGIDWLKLGLVCGATFATYQFDKQIRDKGLEIHGNHPGYRNSIIMTTGNEWGGFFVGPILGVSLYTTGSLFKCDKTKKIGFEIVQALIYSEVISFTSKTIIGRARPFTDRGPHYFTAFAIFNSPYNSFPAGHTCAAFSLSTVLAKNTDSYILKVLAYTPAALTAVARVYTDSHWASDVVIGSALGYFVGNWVVNIHEQKDTRVQLSSVYPLTVKISLN